MLLSAFHKNFKLATYQPIGGVFRILRMSNNEEEEEKKDVTKWGFLALFKISFTRSVKICSTLCRSENSCCSWETTQQYNYPSEKTRQNI